MDNCTTTELIHKLDAIQNPALLLKNSKIMYGNSAAERIFGTIWCGHGPEAMFDKIVGAHLNAPCELYNMYSRDGVKYDLCMWQDDEYFILELLPDAGKLTADAAADLMQCISIKLLDLLQGCSIRSCDEKYMRQFTRLARHIGDLAQFEKNSKLYTPVLLDVREYLKTFAERLQQELSVSRIRVLPLKNTLLMELDAIKFDVVMYNLLSNALKFSPNESDVIVRPWSERGMLYIAVEDEGAGFDFNAVRSAAQAKLGLELVDRIVKLMDGQWLKHNNNGACVAIGIPVVTSTRLQLRDIAPIYNNGSVIELLRMEMAEYV